MQEVIWRGAGVLHHARFRKVAFVRNRIRCNADTDSSAKADGIPVIAETLTFGYRPPRPGLQPASGRRPSPASAGPSRAPAPAPAQSALRSPAEIAAQPS